MLYVIKVKDKELFLTKNETGHWITNIPTILTQDDATSILFSAERKISDFSEDNWYKRQDLELRQITYQII